jgi:choice-of-anchor C domain-containing protein
MIRRARFLLFVLALSVVSAGSAMANVVANGSFENGTYVPTGVGYDRVAAGSPDIAGWSVGGNAVDWHDTTVLSPAQDGTYMVDLNLSGGGLADTGTLSQSFPTIIGGQYRLTFYLAGPDVNFQDPRQVQVDVAGVTQTFSTPASANLSLLWQQHELLFTATSSTTTLMFSSVDGTGFYGPVLDNVSVEPLFANVPTLGQGALILLALLILVSGTLLAGRRRAGRTAR